MDIKNFYVSPQGCDCNCGCEEKPFATIDMALSKVNDAVSSGKYSQVNILLCKGEYNVESIKLTKEHSGTAECPVAIKALDGAVISGGRVLDFKDFGAIDDDVKERLYESARDKVVGYDLLAHGITREQIGDFYAIASCCGQLFKDHVDGLNCELFWNNKRMSIAKYPNEGFTKIREVFEVGDCGEFPPQNYDGEFWKKQEPKGFSIYVDKETNERVKNWKDPQKVWLYGYFYWDWADASSQILRVEPRLRRIFMKHPSHYGVRKDAPIRFVNVLEELDYPGEYYIDREKMMLYIYPLDDDNAPRITISMDEYPLIDGNEVEYVTIEGITFECTKSDAIKINGNNCSIMNCTIRNVFSSAIQMNGHDNVIYGCDISHTGGSGIAVNGGDRKTLTHGNNVIENNFIHDWSEVKSTYTPGISTNGCGNIISHNELCNAPHMAIGYSGNEHIIEYNYMHEVVLHSADAGAVYSGRDWTMYGNVMRYNVLENVGSDEFKPCGIYWDDTLAGQTAYGNLLINVRGNGFLVGGGRDNTVVNNIILNSDIPIHFDARARDAITKNGWYTSGRDKNCGTWQGLASFRKNSEAFAQKYPQVMDIHNDFDNIDDPNFCMNPSNALVKNNVLVYTDRPDIATLLGDGVERFGKVEYNLSFASADECLDNDDGSYKLKDEVLAQLDNFEPIPVQRIGRYKE